MVNYLVPTAADLDDPVRSPAELAPTVVIETAAPPHRRQLPCGAGAATRRDRGRRPAGSDQGRNAREEETVSLRDGARVVIRPIRQRDGALLAEGFSRLSAQSRWFRFLTA